MDRATLDRLRAAARTRTGPRTSSNSTSTVPSPYDDAVKDTGIEVEAGADAGQATEERAELLASLEVARQRVRAIDEALAPHGRGHLRHLRRSAARRSPHERLEARPLSVRCVALRRRRLR